MKTVLIILCLLSTSSIYAYDEYVSGYRKSNGTYVAPFHRSSPNYTTSDNYSSYGNTNPYTGQKGYVRNSYTTENRGLAHLYDDYRN